MSERKRPPQTRRAETHTITLRGQRGRIKAHVTLGFYEGGAPCEIFVSVAKVGSDLRTSFNAWAMTASSALQHGLPLAALAKSVRHIRDETGDEHASSMWDAIAQLLEVWTAP